MNRDDERHASRQLASLLRSEIEEGVKYPAGSKLPSYRDLAQLHAHARNTVQVAIRLLEDEGLVEIRGTSGVYVRNREHSSTREDRLRVELSNVRRQLQEARQVLADTDEAVAGLLTELPRRGLEP